MIDSQDPIEANLSPQRNMVLAYALSRVARCLRPFFEKRRNEKVPWYANNLGNTSANGLSLSENAIVAPQGTSIESIKWSLSSSAIEKINITQNGWLFIER